MFTKLMKKFADGGTVGYDEDLRDPRAQPNIDPEALKRTLQNTIGDTPGEGVTESMSPIDFLPVNELGSLATKGAGALGRGAKAVGQEVMEAVPRVLGNEAGELTLLPGGNRPTMDKFPNINYGEKNPIKNDVAAQYLRNKSKEASDLAEKAKKQYELPIEDTIPTPDNTREFRKSLPIEDFNKLSSDNMLKDMNANSAYYKLSDINHQKTMDKLNKEHELSKGLIKDITPEYREEFRKTYDMPNSWQRNYEKQLNQKHFPEVVANRQAYDDFMDSITPAPGKLSDVSYVPPPAPTLPPSFFQKLKDSLLKGKPKGGASDELEALKRFSEIKLPKEDNVVPFSKLQEKMRKRDK